MKMYEVAIESRKTWLIVRSVRVKAVSERAAKSKVRPELRPDEFIFGVFPG